MTHKNAPPGTLRPMNFIGQADLEATWRILYRVYGAAGAHVSDDVLRQMAALANTLYPKEHRNDAD